MVCSCNHLTAFGGFLDYVAPDINSLDGEDFTNLTKLNPDNFTTAIVMFSLGILYFVFMVLLSAGSLFFDKIQEVYCKCQYKSVDGVRVEGKTRMMVEQWKKNHIWFSLFFLPVTETTFTRMRRLTIVYMILLGILGSNAITFGRKQENELQMLASVVLSDILTTPFVFLFSLLFIKTATWGKHIQKKRKEIAPSNSLSDTSSTTSTNNRIFPIRDPNIKLNKADRGIFYEAPLPVLTNAWEIVDTDLGFARQFSNENFVKTFMTCEQPKKNPKRSIIQVYHETLGTVFDLIDRLITGVEIRIDRLIRKGTTPVGVAVLILGTIMWFSMVGVAAWLSRSLHWVSKVGVFLISTAGVVIYVGVLEYLYLSSKIRRYRNSDMRWRPSKMWFGVQIAICSISFVLISLVEAGVILLGLFSGIEWENVTILSIGLLAISTCIGIWLFMIIKIPKREKNAKRKFSGTWLPPIFAPVIYFFTWLWIVGMSFILVLYGIRFDQIDPGSDKKWLITSLLGTSENVFLTQPLKFFFRAVLFVMVIRLFEDLFFQTGRSNKPSLPK